MHVVAPNISIVVGPLIGARLISYAGGLQRLAMLPSSTIQILGAEKHCSDLKNKVVFPLNMV